jgi:hypothetical protein
VADDDPLAGYDPKKYGIAPIAPAAAAPPPSAAAPGAADPLAGYDPSKYGLGPTATTPGAAGGQDLGSTAIWNKPANVGWNDYLLAHLAAPFRGAGQASED